MSTCPLFLLPSLLLSSPGLAQDGQAPTSPVTWLDQDRLVYASASAEGSPISFDSASAPDYGPFLAGVDAGAGGAFARALQSSLLEQDGIIAKGGVDSIGFVFGDRVGQSYSLSSISLRFSVSTRASYQARGVLAAAGFEIGGSGSGSHVGLLQADGTPIFVREASGPDTSVTIDEVGLLGPGEYVLELWAGAGGTGQFWNRSASFDLDLDIRGVARQ